MSKNYHATAINVKIMLKDIGNILDRLGVDKDKIILKGTDRTRVTEMLLHSSRNIEELEQFIGQLKKDL